MNHEPIDEDWIPERKTGYQLPAPSAFLREKILQEASSAWEENTPVEEVNSWSAPLLRLAASITIAALIVIIAHKGDQYALARWQPSPQTTVSPHDTDDQWSELYPELIKIRQVATSSSHRVEIKDLMLHFQRLREATDDTESPGMNKRLNSTQFFNPRLHDHLINSTEILNS